jgi:hypothetical protein
MTACRRDRLTGGRDDVGRGPRRRVLGQSFKGHPQGPVALISRVRLRRDVHPSHESERHQTRDGSPCWMVNSVWWALTRTAMTMDAAAMKIAPMRKVRW